MRRTGGVYSELHYVVVDAATCAAVVFDELVALDDYAEIAYVGSSSMQNDPRVCGVLQETQGSREINFLLRSRRCSSFTDNDMDVYELDSFAATVSRCTSALEFLSEWPGCPRFQKKDNRELRRQTRKAEDIYAIRGRWSERRWRTNPRELFRYCDATLHVRDFRRIAAEAEAVVSCELIAARSYTTGHHFYTSAKTMVKKRSLALAASAVAPSPS